MSSPVAEELDLITLSPKKEQAKREVEEVHPLSPTVVEETPPSPVPQEHTVKSGETLNSIAAFYDTTPSHLAQTNRISLSRLIFPGDKLVIPPPFSEKQPLSVSPKKDNARPRIHQRHVVVEEEEITEPQFIKMNVRHITDGNGVVLGSILISPKSFMFNPNLTDLLVKENEADFYQIIAPAELVVNMAIFKDFGRFNSTFGIANKESNVSMLYVPAEGEEDLVDVGHKATTPTDEPGEDDETSKKSLLTKSLSTEEEPMYLRLVMGKPIAKRLPRTAPIVSYGQQNLEPEYWFVVQRRKCKILYDFFNQIFPTRYGLLDHSAIERSGYEVIRKGIKLLEEEAGSTCNRETVARIIHKNLTMTDLDVISEMIGESEILLDSQEREKVAKCLPPRTDGHNWELFFSTKNNGFNLNSFYRRLAKYEGPVIVFMEDVKGRAFGAYLSDMPRLAEHFYGTGESFVFKLRPEFKVFRWTGENEYFIKGELTHLIIGSGNGAFALWIDADLNQGRSVSCPTFDNEPLAIDDDFTLKSLECWAFVLS